MLGRIQVNSLEALLTVTQHFIMNRQSRSRSRRHTVQPKSYKEFSERGYISERETPNSKCRDLMWANIGDESWESNSENSDNSTDSDIRFNNNKQCNTPEKLGQCTPATHNTTTGKTERSIRHNSGTDNLQYVEDSMDEARELEEQSPSILETQQVAIHVNPTEDDLDLDQGKSRKCTTSSALSPTKRTKAIQSGLPVVSEKATSPRKK